jgi:hypothetical protein
MEAPEAVRRRADAVQQLDAPGHLPLKPFALRQAFAQE